MCSSCFDSSSKLVNGFYYHQISASRNFIARKEWSKDDVIIPETVVRHVVSNDYVLAKREILGYDKVNRITTHIRFEWVILDTVNLEIQAFNSYEKFKDYSEGLGISSKKTSSIKGREADSIVN